MYAFRRSLHNVKYIKQGTRLVNDEELAQIESAAVRLQLYNERMKEIKEEYESSTLQKEKHNIEKRFWEMKEKAFICYQLKQDAIIAFLESEPLARQIASRLTDSYTQNPTLIPLANKFHVLLELFEALPLDEKYTLIQFEYQDPVSSADGYMSLKERYDVAPSPIEIKQLY